MRLFCFGSLDRNPRPNVPFGTGGELLNLELRKLLYYPLYYEAKN